MENETVHVQLVLPTNMPLEEKIQRLSMSNTGMTAWEISFIESTIMQRWRGEGLSLKQISVIDRMALRHLVQAVVVRNDPTQSPSPASQHTQQELFS